MGNIIDYEYKPTRGAAVGDIQNVANGATLEIRPPVGETWRIETLSFGGACSIDWTDGTLTNNVDTPTAAATIEKGEYSITHDVFLVITNNSGGTQPFSYSGYKINENI